MATDHYELAKPPTEERELELWLQHAAGKILFEDVRQFALDQIDQNTSAQAKAEAAKAIDNAMGGLMQILDGVTGSLSSKTHAVSLVTRVRLEKITPSGDRTPVAEMDLSDGDGMCMGFAGWLENDFGKRNVARRKRRN